MYRINTPRLKWLCLTVLAFSACLIDSSVGDSLMDEYDGNSGRYNIEGKVYAPELFSLAEFNWQEDTAITINDGEYSAFLKDDGTFVISGVPSGSYVVDISNPDYYYESVIVEHRRNSCTRFARICCNLMKLHNLSRSGLK